MKKSGLVSGILGLVAAIVYFAPMSDCAAPRLIAPICGVLSVVMLYHLVRIFVAANLVSHGGDSPVAALAAIVASVVFMLTPAVRSAAMHFEPRLVDFALALLIVVITLPFRSRAVWLCPVLVGAGVSLGLLDSALFLALAPLYLVLVAHVSRCARGLRAPAGSSSRQIENQPSASRPFAPPVSLFLVSALLTFSAAAFILHLDLAVFFRRTMAELTSYYRTPGWIFVFFFTTLPFLTVLFSEEGALWERPGFVQLFFHGALSFVTILAVVPPLSPSSLMSPYGRLPVATSAFAASVAGYLVAYWWINRRTVTARAVGGILVLALAGTALWNLFTFDGKAGAARRIVIRMDADRAREILRKDPDSPLANYIMGSLALKAGRDAEAETCLRKAIQAPQPMPFALNDFAEVQRRRGNYAEAERFARQCVSCAPSMYVGWETLGSVLMDAGKNLEEAESAIRRACELSKGGNGKQKDVRMLVSLVRIQLKRGDARRAQTTIREIQSRVSELSGFERAEFEKLLR